MTAFFFGPAGRQLFGYYHSPRGQGGGATVICPSWGPEYQYSHRALRVTARRLAERGVHVLRFDYSGTGDSWGDGTDGGVERWKEDTAFAIDELKAMSGVPRADLVGLRFGARIAAAASAARSDIRKLVLWEPVLDGQAWVRELSPERTGVLSTGTAPEPRSAPTAAPIEFAYRLVAPSLVTDFASIDPSGYSGANAENSLLVESVVDDGHRYAALHAALPGLERRLVEDALPWREDMSIWSGAVPAKVITTIADWLVTR